MGYIAIIAAMEQEMRTTKNIMSDIKEVSFFDKTVFIGKIKYRDCLLVQCGVGKVNAGRVTQLVIDKFNVSAVINVGSAGALVDTLNVGDVVISTGVVQHDFDITAFDHEKGYITDIGKIIEADATLIDVCENVMKRQNIKVEKGLIATGDIFCNNEESKRKINRKFGALCVDMEGASIAQVCYLCKVPYIVIRSISDNVVGNANVDFYKFLDMASVRCANILEDVFTEVKFDY